jgi:hypothetical protein
METRHLLPASAYRSEDWFEREQDRLFSRTWHLVGSEEDLPGPGSYPCPPFAAPATDDRPVTGVLPVGRWRLTVVDHRP